MSVVLDASITIAWLNEQETTPAIEQVFAQLEGVQAWVPSLWWLEVANVLQMSVRRRRLTLSERSSYLIALRNLQLHTDLQTAEHAWSESLTLSDRHNLTVYDAAYLELALRRRLPLATLDRELRAAASVEAVPLLGI